MRFLLILFELAGLAVRVIVVLVGLGLVVLLVKTGAMLARLAVETAARLAMAAGAATLGGIAAGVAAASIAGPSSSLDVGTVGMTVGWDCCRSPSWRRFAGGRWSGLLCDRRRRQRPSR